MSSHSGHVFGPNYGGHFLIAASHLVGAGEVQNFIQSRGTKEVARDGLGTTLTEYLAGFSDQRYSVDYSIDGLMSAFILREMAMKVQQSFVEEKLDALLFAEDLETQAKEMEQSPEYEEYRRAAQDIAEFNTRIPESDEAVDMAKLCERMQEEAAAYAATAEGQETLRWAEQLKLDSQKAIQDFATDPENQDFLKALGVSTDMLASSDKQ